jgi:hypothetical protein
VSFSSHRLFVRLPVAAALLAAAGCAAGGTVSVSPPAPPAAVPELCQALHAALPQAVDGLRQRTTAPASPYTAAWGDPAVVLRCGTPSPDVLTPGNAHYNPTTDAAEINGVDWLVEQQPQGAYRFTTTDREAWVEVFVPSKYAPQVNPLTDLAPAINKTLPTTVAPGTGTR